MQFIEHTFTDPASNIAFDEALLESAETGLGGQTLRIWESPVYFAVLGYSSRWQHEIIHAHKVPFIRRKSGGQTVLQGPGCLNFTLILKSDPSSGIRTDTLNAMTENKKAAELCLKDDAVEILGISDLNWKGRKFSGNAMRRGKTHYLFHGTFLYDFDLTQIQNLLGKPDREPEYRAGRSHSDFLTNIPAAKKDIINALQKTWGAEEPLRHFPESETKILTDQIYSQDDWNRKF